MGRGARWREADFVMAWKVLIRFVEAGKYVTDITLQSLHATDKIIRDGTKTTIVSLGHPMRIHLLRGMLK